MRFVSFVLLSVFSFAADQHSATAAADNDVRDMIQRYAADRGNLARFYTIDISRTRSDRFRKFYSDTLAELDRVPFDALTE